MYERQVANINTPSGVPTRVATREKLRRLIESKDAPEKQRAHALWLLVSTHEIDAGNGPFTELQVGSYIFWDVQYDSVVTRADGTRPFEPALFVQLSVVSNTHPLRPTTDGGYKRFATDGPAPRIGWWRGNGMGEPGIAGRRATPVS